MAMFFQRLTIKLDQPRELFTLEHGYESTDNQQLLN